MLSSPVTARSRRTRAGSSANLRIARDRRAGVRKRADVSADPSGEIGLYLTGDGQGIRSPIPAPVGQCLGAQRAPPAAVRNAYPLGAIYRARCGCAEATATTLARQGPPSARR